MPTSPAQSTEVPKEAVEQAICERLGYSSIERFREEHEGNQQEKLDLERGVLEAAAPALRKQGADQERQRLKEALLSDKALDAATGAAYTQPISSNRREDMRAAITAALDTLEADRG